MPDPDHDPTERLLDLIREAGHLIRDGSTDEERERFFARRAALYAELDTRTGDPS